VGLRTCPLCASRAIAEVLAEQDEPERVRCLVRCGGCETWRGTVLPRRQGRRVHRQLRRRARRDGRRLARALRRVEAALDAVMADTVRR
jgi:hypothetical protein